MYTKDLQALRFCKLNVNILLGVRTLRFAKEWLLCIALMYCIVLNIIFDLTRYL